MDKPKQKPKGLNIKDVVGMGKAKVETAKVEANKKPQQTSTSKPTAKDALSIKGDKLFKSVFGPLMFANHWQKASDNKQSKIMQLFHNPRNDPYDVYKPNSKVETQVNIETPYDKPLPDSTADMIQEIASNYDYCTELDVVETFTPNTFISVESRDQLDRLPTWLRFLIVFKYDQIHAHYGHHTHHYIKLLANKIDVKRTTNLESFEIPNDEDLYDNDEIIERYGVDEKGHPLSGEGLVALHEVQKISEMQAKDLFRLKFAVWKWKLPKTMEQDWAPVVIHRAATTLRRALLIQASPTEVAMVAEDEKIQRDEDAANHNDFDDEDNDADDKFKRPNWEDMVADKAGFKDEVAVIVEEDLKRIPTGLSKAEKEEERKLAKEVEQRRLLLDDGKDKSKKRRTWWEGVKDNEILKNRRERKERKVSLSERATFRRYSRIWHKNCPMEPIKQAKRLPHHYRIDESFHAYIVALVGSRVFKFFIMFVIIANALVLAIETGESDSYILIITFEILDDFFLSVYVVEFILKVYAHPYSYWRSGFNVFDFIILMVSMIKAIIGWVDLKNISFLKVLVIVRALRVLRGISMSVQIQVLITALVETLKTHVLSVLILLFLLMYIASIMAYYLFSEISGLETPWGNIFEGMLRLFSFVTMDGWTQTSDEFEAADRLHTGRVFCLICILLGNFLISNIFIAIIIMQISEATEAFRSRQRDEREEIITLKKEIVFRRQKLDMRQLLAKQNLSMHADFYYLGSQFLRLLRHDDLVDMNDVPFSPLWMDAFYKGIHRCHHTANLLMNLHRQMADNLLVMYQRNNESQYTVTPIRRGRYNRYMKLKSKLALLRQEFYKDSPDAKKINRPLRFRFAAPPPETPVVPPDGSNQESKLNDKNATTEVQTTEKQPEKSTPTKLKSIMKKD